MADQEGQSIVNINDYMVDGLLKGRYSVHKMLGRGSQGQVYKCTDTIFQSDVAVKVMNNPFSSDFLARRVLRELLLSKRMKHVNIIEFYTAFTTSQSLEDFNTFFMVMECMDCSLDDVIHKRFDLDQKRLSFLTYQLFCGLNYMHKAGIIHRDIKPSNIVCNSQCVLKILDFGLARKVDLSQSMYVTTRFYRAPEVLLYMKYDDRIDVWSAGCLLAELFLKEIVFRGKDFFNQTVQIISVFGPFEDELVSQMDQYVRGVYNDRLLNQGMQHRRDLFSRFQDHVFPPDIDGNLCAAQAVDLLRKMLIVNPAHRVTIRQALEHPYVKVWHDETEINSVPDYFDSGTSEDPPNLQALKEAVYNELDHSPSVAVTPYENVSNATDSLNNTGATMYDEVMH